MRVGRCYRTLGITAVLLSLVTLGVISEVNAEISLERLDSLYLPYTYAPSPQYGLDKAAAEQIAYDGDKHLIYAVGNSHIHVIDARDPNTLNLLIYEDVGPGLDLTDVEVCGGFVFVGADNTTMREEGRLMIFEYDPDAGALRTLHSVTVGPLPDMIRPTKDCNTVFVALEAEAYVVNDVIIDPEGGFGIFRWNSSDVSSNVEYRKINFTQFNSRTEELVERGVRFVYRENNNTLSRDLEPEYITLNEDESMAYVCLQENSAIAVVNVTDLDTADVIDIYPLGFKSWINYTMDASDKDKESLMKQWPVYGMLQPDSIHYITHNGEGYLITANEGDSKEYVGSSETLFVEDRRGSKMLSEHLTSPEVGDQIREFLGNDAQLGRLKFQFPFGMANGTDRLFSYGGRGFSLVRTRDMEVVYDSGDSVEESILRKYPALFNCNPKEDETPWMGTDKRSDDKGPECESVTHGDLWGKSLIFMGNERPGTISVYSLEEGSVTPRFESVHFAGVLQTGRTWGAMFERRTTGDLDPEDLRFVPPEKSGNGQPLLMVSGSVSGTVSVYRVVNKDTTMSTTSGPTTPVSPDTTMSTTSGPTTSVSPDTTMSTTSGPTVPVTPDTTMSTKPGSTTPVSSDTIMSTTSGPTKPVSPEVVCSAGEVKCRNTNRCVAETLRCDGVDDCGDNTDEAGCGLTTSENQKSAEIRSLTIVTVCLAAVCVLILGGLCYILTKRARNKEEYEMKSPIE